MTPELQTRIHFTSVDEWRDVPNAVHEQIDKTVPLGDISLGMKRLKASDMSIPKVSRAVQKLGFIHLRYKDFTVKEAAAIIGVTVQTGYRWQREWNKNQMESVLPNFNGGRKPCLSEAQKSQLRSIVCETNPTTKEAREIISEKFGVSYSEKQVHVILASMGMRHVSMPPVGSGDGRRRMRWMS